MPKVEPSGVILHGVCDIQTERCTAKTGGAITAVWGPPGRTQIKVCRVCLEEKMRRGEGLCRADVEWAARNPAPTQSRQWKVEGARLRQPV
jgi:hypothetical protein